MTEEVHLQRALQSTRAALVPSRREPTEIGLLLREKLAQVAKLGVPVLYPQPPPSEDDETRWARRAVGRGCPAHRSTLDGAFAPRETGPLSVVRRSLEWSRQRSRPHRRQPFIVVLLGPSGIGKSVALTWAVGHAEREARFATAHTIASLPSSDWSAFVEAREVLARTPLLAIDEAGLEYAARAGQRISLLLHERYDAGLQTFVASNMEADDFMARYFAPPEGDEVNVKAMSRLEAEQRRAGCEPFWTFPPGDLRGVAILPSVRRAARP